MRNLQITQNYFSETFWKIVFDFSFASIERSELIKIYKETEENRDAADYKTGSISLSECFTLYSLARYFQPSAIAEVGSFIGRSTLSLALGLKNKTSSSFIFTCDASNSIELNSSGTIEIRSYPKTYSYDMFRQIELDVDLFFVDGSLGQKDLPEISRLSHDKSIFIFDDCEGVEKGMENLFLMRNTMKNYFLIYPPERTVLEAYGFTKPNKIMVALPYKLLQLKAQAE